MAKIKLEEDEVQYLIDFVKKGQKSARELTRARILLLANNSTSPTGSANHLSPLRFQTFNEKYFEIGMKLNDFSIQLVKYWNKNKTTINPTRGSACQKPKK